MAGVLTPQCLAVSAIDEPRSSPLPSAMNSPGIGIQFHNIFDNPCPNRIEMYVSYQVACDNLLVLVLFCEKSFTVGNHVPTLV